MALPVKLPDSIKMMLGEFIDDPDSGLALKAEIRQQLIDSLQETEAGIRGVPAQEVAKKLALDW